MVKLQQGQLIQVNGLRCYTVQKDRGDSLVCMRYGSGDWSRIIPKADNTIVPVDKLPDNTESGYTTLDSVEDDNGNLIFYPCLCNPINRWNGWAIPFLNKETFKRLLNDLNMKIVGHRDNYIIALPIGELDADIEDYGTCIYKKDGGYTIDGWCWDYWTVKEKENYIKSREE